MPDSRRPIRVLLAVFLATAVVSGAGRPGPAPAAPGQGTAPSWALAIDKVFSAWDRPDSPGCAVGLFKDGRIVYEKGFGSADLEHGVAITPQTMFYAGSVSKQFTAMAVALAIQKGLFGADDDVRKFVPELPDYGTPVTVRHLIHHTSGLRDINTLMSIAGRRDEDAFDNDAVLRILARQKALNFKPGDEHLYSNSGYAVLALIVERTSRMSFADFAAANIFAPLGMTETHFHTDLGRLVPNRGYAYDRPTAGPVRLNTPANERAGAGGLFTNVRDLLAWDENFYTGRVGGKELIARLETPGRLNSGAALVYAWGLQVGTYRGLPIVEHSGALGGYRAQIIRFRGQHVTAALLCNAGSIDPSSLSRRMADVYLKDAFTEPVPAPRPPAAAAAVASAPRAQYTPDELAAFAGTYESTELETTYRVTRDGDALRLTRGVQRAQLALRPSEPRDEFSVSGATLRFSRDAGGRVSGITVDAGRIRGVVFTRVR